MAKEYIGITDQLNIVNVPRANIDAKYGTYTSQSEALTSVPKSLREKGLTVGILVDGTVVEYWFKAGIEDVDLVPKQTGGGGGIDGLDAIRISLSNMNVILKEGKTGMIENWEDSEGEMTVVEGDLSLRGVGKVHTETNSCFWIDEIIATGIAAGSITSSGNKVYIGRASDMVNSTATIKYVVKGLRKEGQSFTQDIYQKYTKVVDGKGMEINIKGTADTVGIGDDYPVSPEEGHTHIRMYHGYVYKYVGSTWTTLATAEISDAYICRADGHLYVWDGDSWNDAGEFKGEPGDGAYVHFAYADYIELDAEGRYISDSAVGFTVLDTANKAWLGHYWDYVEKDSQDPGRYTWSNVVLQNTFKSIVFTKSDTEPETPIIGGSYNSPYPTNTHLVDGEQVLTWSDGIPEGDGMVWSAYRLFTSDGKAPQMSEWVGPTLMADTPDFDVEWSSKENPTIPVGHPNQNRVERGGDWSDNSDNAIWKATSNKRNGRWSEWKVSRIEGEKGQSSFQSTIFIRSDANVPDKPGADKGSFTNPTPDVVDGPTGQRWSDGIPSGKERLWACTRIFSSDGLHPQQDEWKGPFIMADHVGFDVEFSSIVDPVERGKPGGPPNKSGEPGYNANWSNEADETTVWMATSYMVDGAWTEWQIVKIRGEGEGGLPGQGTFKSIVFTRSKTPPGTPIGGSYGKPKPDTPGWFDGVPEGTDPLYASTRIFTTDGKSPQQIEWQTPEIMADSPDLDVEFSSVVDEGSRGLPGGPPNEVGTEGYNANWSNKATPSTVWMAVSRKSGGVWSDWEIMKVKGEAGQGSLKSTMFTRNSLGTPTKPLDTHGSYLAPSPEVTVSGTKWTDGIPPGVGKLWATSRIFTSDGLAPQQASWAKPEVMVDSAGFDVEWSTSKTRPTDPVGHPNTNTAWSNTATEDAIWMATSYKNNGEWSAWQVVKVKGETGPSGEYDPTKVSVPYMAGDWESGKEYVRDNFSYPVVSYGVTASGQPQFYFLKVVNKTITSSTPPPEDVTNWQPLSQFSMIFTESLFSDYSKLGSFQFNGRTLSSVEGNKPDYTDPDFIPNFSVNGLTGKLKAKNAEVEGTVTAGGANSARTVINNDGIHVFNASGIMNIRFGLKDGHAVMEYYDNDGNFLYDLGPNGITKVPVRAEAWILEKYVYLGTSISSVLTDSAVRQKYMTPSEQTETSFYRYQSKIVAGVNDDPTNDGKMFNSDNKSSGYINPGVYMRKTTGMAGEALTEGTGARIYPIGIADDNIAVYDSPPLYYVDLLQPFEGVMTGTNKAYWNG